MLKAYLVRRAVVAALLMTTLTACAPAQSVTMPPTAQNLPATVQPQTPTAQNLPATVEPQAPTAQNLPATVQPAPPTAQPTMRPTIAFSPQTGGPGTVVQLSGWGFAPNAPVTVRLGTPRPIGEALAGVIADPSGAWSTPITIPGALPSGEPIAGGQIFLVAMSDQNVALASAPFAFTAAPVGPSRAEASATVRRFLEAYFGGRDATVFLGGAALDEVRAGRPLHQLVGDQPGYQGFTVFEPDNNPSEVLFVRANVTYGGGAMVENVFNLAVSGGKWVIVGISATGGSSNHTPGGPQAWRDALSGDLNGDGVAENIAYRPVQIQLPPVGFSDPSIVSVMIASEMTVQMQVSPGGRELLYLSPSALMAEGTMLAGFDPANPPAGFIVVVYGGNTHSFHISPLRADGQSQGNVSYQVVWSPEEQGYRLR